MVFSGLERGRISVIRFGLDAISRLDSVLRNSNLHVPLGQSINWLAADSFRRGCNSRDT